MQTLFIVAALLFLGTAIFVVARLGSHHDKTISIHIGWKKWSIVTFMITNTISTALLAVATFGWFGPHFGLSPVFYILAGVTLLLLLAVGIFPHITATVPSTVSRIHVCAAWPLMIFFTLVAIDVLIELFATLSQALIAFLLVVIAWGMFLGIFVVTARKKFQDHILIYEGLQIAGFFAVLISVSYLA